MENTIDYFNFTLKERKYIDKDVKGDKFLPLWKHYRKLKKIPLDSEENIIKFLEYFSELFEIIDENYIKRLIEKFAYTSIKNTIRLVWYFLRFGVWIYFKRIKIYKILTKNSIFQQLPDDKYGVLKKNINRELELYSFKNYFKKLFQNYI